MSYFAYYSVACDTLTLSIDLRLECLAYIPQAVEPAIVNKLLLVEPACNVRAAWEYILNLMQ